MRRRARAGPTGSRPRLAVFKLASCDGCQLSLLDCEDELLAVADRVEIAHFAEASSRVRGGPFDLTLVEGSITTPRDASRIRRIRAESRALVTLGACATAGGIQALRNFRDHAEMMRQVYARPDFVESLATSTPVSAHVPVDFELRGCPVDKRQLLEVVSAYVNGRRPVLPAHAACIECKSRGNVCVAVVRGEPCLGPVTHAGCGALCPSFDRGCFGCFGPSNAPNAAALGRELRERGASDERVRRLFSTFHAASDAFRDEAERHE